MTLPGAQEPVELDVPGGVVPVRLVGSGPPVVLIHGISADHTEWLPVARLLAPNYRVILPDLLGRGTSLPEPSARYRLADEADRAALILDRLQVENPLVAGHSNGASVAMALACRRPVAGLLFANPVTPWTKRPAILGLLRRPLVRRFVAPPLRICRRPLTRYILTRRVYGEHAPIISDAVRRYARPYADPARAQALLRIFADWSPPELDGLPVPPVEVRVLAGELDRRIPPEDARRWADRIGASFELVAGAGHGLPEEVPGRVVDRLRQMHRNDEPRSP